MANIIQDSEAPNPLLVAGDVHNVGNSNFQFTDPTTWLDPAMDAASSLGKFTVAAVTSGVEGIYNTGVMAVNAMGADAEEMSTADVLRDMDSSLSDYYLQNKNLIDITGFAISSLVPGTAGVKIVNAGAKMLNAAQYSGKLGTLARVTTGLLDGSATNVMIAKNGAALAQSETALSMINGATLKAMGTSFAKNALESAVFEVAAVTALQGSAYVRESEWQDLAKNAATGMLLGGAIGGTIESIGIFGKLKKTVGEMKAGANPDRYRTALAPTVDASDGLILRGQEIEARLAAADSLSDISKHTIQSMQIDVKNFAKNIGGESHGQALTDIALNGTSKEVFERLQNVRTISAVSGQKVTSTQIKLFGDDAGSVIVANNGEQVFAKKLGDLFESPAAAQKAVAAYAKDIKPIGSILDLDAVQSELRYAAFRDTPLKKLEGFVASPYDIPALEWMLANKASLPKAVAIKAGDSLTTVDSMSNGALFDLLQQAKIDVARGATESGKSIPEAARYANVKERVLKGEMGNPGDDFFASQADFNSYKTAMQARNLPVDRDALYRPTHGEIRYSADLKKSAKELMEEQGVTDAYKIAAIRNQQGFDAMRTELAQTLGADVVASLPELRTNEILADVHRQAVGSSFFGTASQTSGTAAKAEFIGKQVAQILEKRIAEFDSAITNVATTLRNNKAAAIEFEALSQEANRTVRRYIPLEHGGKRYLIDAGIDLTKEDLEKVLESGGKAFVQQTGARPVIQVENEATFRAIKEHITAQDSHLDSYAAIARGRGEQSDHLTSGKGTFYGIKPDPKKYAHVAFVKDLDLVEGAAGQMTMIHAASPQELEILMRSVKNAGDRYQVIDKTDTANWHAIAGDYDRTKTLWRTSIDSSLGRQGINSKFFQSTDANAIVDDLIRYHRAAIANKTRAEIAAHYQEAFTTFRGLGEEYARVAGSKYGTAIENWLDTKDQNPAFDFIKTALNISRRAEYPNWDGFNTLLSSGFSKAWNTLSSVVKEAPTAESLQAASRELEKYGAKTAYNDAALEIFRNHRAGGQELTKFVSTVNGAMGFLTLRMDPLNALNNVLGSNILMSTEARTQIKNLRLEGIGDIASPGKLIFAAQRDFFSAAKPEMERYVKLGIVPEKSVSAIEKLLNDVAITGAETASELGARTSRIAATTKELMAKAEKYSGNLMAEANTRYVSARVADAIGAAKGLTGPDLDVFVNGFVNRVNGNLLASQRPTLFQGPLGQAIGLFQSYQFNLMQNMFRHVAEGRGKDVAMMMGMQSTLYGAKSLPGFEYINTSILGMASGNKEHRDLYDATYGALGKSGAEALLYGIPSNLLGAGIFSRGDTNPRNLTIVPTSLAEIPVVGAAMQMYKNGVDVARNISGGAGIVNSLIAGIEHNGISRPMTGLAQLSRAFTSDTGQAFSTTGKGTLIGASDLASWSSAVRAAGGKPFDEAIASDKIYRIGFYAAQDKAKLLDVAETAKVAFGGKQGGIGADQLEGIMRSYVAAGGKQQSFNQWAMKQMLSANTPTAEQMIQKLKSGNAQKLQQLMGGTLPEGFGEQ